MKISELARQVGATFVPGANGDVEIAGVGPLDKAGPDAVTFLTNSRYRPQLDSSRAAAVVIAEADSTVTMGQIVHANPQYIWARTCQIFFRDQPDFAGISDLAFIAPDARIGHNVTIAPFAYVGRGVTIGDNSVLYPQVYVGRDSTIGPDCIIHPGVVIAHGSRIGARVIIDPGAVIGGDGFGFAPGAEDIAKIPQTGNVVIEDDVEIGSLSNIDRGALKETRIRRGTKLDSLVHVAHNVDVGEHCMLCGQVGIAGSAKIGNWVIMAGQAAVNGHTKVGDRVVLGARGVIDADLEEAGTYHGFPAKPSRTHWREQAAVAKLPDLIKEIKELRQEVAALRAKAGS